MPDVEFLYWDGCPSHPRALTELRQVLGDVGLDPDDIRVREILTDEQAESAGFKGSPTILIDGRDAVDAEGEPVMLACRVYWRRDGRVSPVPDPDDLRDVLRGALERGAR